MYYLIRTAGTSVNLMQANSNLKDASGRRVVYDRDEEEFACAGTTTI
jgi:hypothetical protein